MNKKLITLYSVLLASVVIGVQVKAEQDTIQSPTPVSMTDSDNEITIDSNNIAKTENIDGESTKINLEDSPQVNSDSDYKHNLHKVSLKNKKITVENEPVSEISSTTIEPAGDSKIETVVPKTSSDSLVDWSNLNTADISGRAHVQNIGWQKYSPATKIFGTTGQGKRMEALELLLEKDMVGLGDITYQSHIQNIGWGPSVTTGKVTGTTGQGKRLEAINMSLSGELSKHFDLYYRTHIQNYGWLGWAKNGENAGTEGLSLRLEAVEIQLLSKKRRFEGDTHRSFIKSDQREATIFYRSYIKHEGWQKNVVNSNLSGTTGHNKQIEAIEIRLDSEYLGHVTYQTHIQNIGWISPVRDGHTSGVGGSNRQIEAIKISLNGDISQYYNVYYRVHVQNKGWLGWARNGEKAGTEGFSLGIEGIEISLIKKGEKVPSTQSNSYFKQTPLSATAKAIQGLGGYVPSNDIRLSLEKSIRFIQNKNYDIAFTLFDLITKKGVSYNGNKKFYIASSIKAPYVASLVAQNPSTFQNYQKTIKDILHYSSNEGYNLLRRTFGGIYMKTWLKEAGCDPALSVPGYPYISSNELAKLWERNDKFFQTTLLGKKMAPWYETPNLSPIYSNLHAQYTTKSKAGWIGEPGYHAANDGGIVTTPKGRYVIAIMSNADGKLNLLDNLVLTLNEVYKDI